LLTNVFSHLPLRGQLRTYQTIWCTWFPVSPF